MERTRSRGLAAAFFFCASIGTAAASSSNPPDYFPGQQGMASCLTCHDSQASYGGPGSATIEGLPPGFHPGQVYTLTVRVKQPGAKKFGFALYAVDQQSKQAGAILTADPKQDVRVRGGVTFLKNSFNGVEAHDEQAWTFQWRAPEDPSARVGFVAEAVAADGHGSVKDDHVYRMEQVLQASEPTHAAAPADLPEVLAGD